MLKKLKDVENKCTKSTKTASNLNKKKEVESYETQKQKFKAQVKSAKEEHDKINKLLYTFKKEYNFVNTQGNSKKRFLPTLYRNHTLNEVYKNDT